MTTLDTPPTASEADVAAARRWMAAFRRIDHVSVVGSGPQARYVVEGTGHRLPLRRTVPASVARGMARLGVPVLRGRTR